MKKIFLSLIISLFCITAFAQNEDEGTNTKIGDNAPAFSFEIEKGKTVNISDYKGKLILINLFATWCPPCNTELPLAQKEIWDKHKADKNFAFFVFGREEGWDKLTPYKSKKEFTFPILPDLDRNIFSKFAKQSIPRNILIDENGKIIYQSIGYEDKEFKALVKLIDTKLKSISATK
ncbi:TlpA family protein disulfide reductase [Pedobacter frigidisoli]|uniref:TlpA family protein disulfide reductase n=1 Tax=Pedobacter frigidisoli TaxID=2530455 RepID=A0A4R0P507_9SPHI|nr:TlpA disulfide reductase family protein [Pedobacter frigidisoli]TCD07121.1 TlpA family protein disulfide reductase [Pedobacter frigidisoli]